MGYPILDLERIGLSLRDYIDALEGAVIRTVARYGIRAGRIAGASGVWIEGAQPARKICAIGVRASRYVTMHGFALNVATDLRYFTHINPCGFTDRGATSIEKEIGRPVPMEEVKRRLVEDLCENLNVKYINNNKYAHRKTMGSEASGESEGGCRDGCRDRHLPSPGQSTRTERHRHVREG